MSGKKQTSPEIVMVPREQRVADLVLACAKHELPFYGPDSLCAKIAAMGYNTNGLYEQVVAVEQQLRKMERSIIG